MRKLKLSFVLLLSVFAMQVSALNNNHVELIVFYSDNCSDDFKEMKHMTSELVTEVFAADVKAGYLSLDIKDYTSASNNEFVKMYNVDKPCMYSVTYSDGDKTVYMLTHSDIVYKKGDDKEAFKAKLTKKIALELKVVKPIERIIIPHGACCGKNHNHKDGGCSAGN